MSRVVTFVRQMLSRSKLTRDITWSMGSFCILAVSGIVINVVVAAVRDAAALGVFNLAYAIYIVASQLAIWGVHYSVLRHAAYYRDNANERDAMFYTAAIVALLLGGLAASILYGVAPWLGGFFQSTDVGAAIALSALGLAFFPLNKVLLAYLNGLREMKAFSVLQAVRYLVVMISVSTLAASSVAIAYMALGFLVAEVVTTVGAIAVIHRRALAGRLQFSRRWTQIHFAFGSKGLAGGMFAEFNSRIDVLLIGYFLTERATGIYSFAAMLVDGLYHVIAMVRINFNPVLVTAIKESKWLDAQRLVRQTRRIIVPVVFVLSLCIGLTYWTLAVFILPAKGLLEGVPSLLVLLAGVTLTSALIPFDNLMVASGHPGYQALQQMGTVVVNVVVAALLLPQTGLVGAALGTTASYFCNVCLLAIFTRRLLNWNLLSNVVRLNS